jgi:predicted RNA binding protein YcfA (HicA-like mRNA interferase family)
MPKLKRLSGKEAVKIFSRFKFHPASQRGSHIKLKRFTDTGEKQILVIPLHDELDRGTLLAIIRQASKFISLQDLKSAFYTE